MRKFAFALFGCFNDTPTEGDDYSDLSWNQLNSTLSDQATLMEEIETRNGDAETWSDADQQAYQAALTTAENLHTERSTRPQHLTAQRHVLDAVPQAQNIAGTISDLATRITVRDHRDIDPRCGYRTDNEYLTDVVNFYTQGTVTPGLEAVNAVGSDEYSVAEWKSGGIFVPETFLPGTITMAPENDQLLGRRTPLPMQTSVVKVRAAVDKDHSESFTGSTKVKRVGEVDKGDASKDEWETISLEANELIGNAYVTQRLIRESPVSIPALIENAFDLAFSYKLREETLFGDGNGRYLGVLNPKNKALNSVTRTAGNADTAILKGTDILKARKHVWGYDNAVWVFNWDLFEIVSQLHVVADGDAGIIKLYSPQQGDVPETLLGRPIVWTEFMPGINSGDGTTIGNWGIPAYGGGFAACVNMTQVWHGQLYKDQARSSHIRFLEREECFQFVMADDARPSWLTKLTPKRGKTQQSPFVMINNTSVVA